MEEPDDAGRLCARTIRLAAAVSLTLAVWAPHVDAQVTTGTIVGTVSDASGVVPGAMVTVREVNKHTSATFVTDAVGGFTAPFLVPGTYTVEASVQGFKKWVRDGIVLQVNQRPRADAAARSGRPPGNDHLRRRFVYSVQI